MDNESNEVNVNEAETEDVFLTSDEDGDEWDNVKWDKDDDDVGFEDDDDTEKADQPNQDAEDKPEESGTDDHAEESEQNTEAQEADQWIELKHLDETRKVGKDEARVLAQKGLDYDRIREERDSLKGNAAKLKDMESFLELVKGEFSTVEDFMDDTRARMKSESDGISYEDALSQLKAARKAPAAATAADTDKHSPVDEFVKRYPEVKASEIPDSVWAETMKNGGDLVSAYGKHLANQQSDRIKQLEAEIETLKNNKKNESRSTGSMKSAGAASQKSAIAALWDEDD